MKKTIYIVCGVLLAFLALFFFLKNDTEIETITEQEQGIDAVLALPSSPWYATYRIASHEYRLDDGVLETQEGIVRIVGEPYLGYVKGDEYTDAVIILSFEHDGVTSYHLGVALQNVYGYMGIETLPLDKGVPVSVDIRNEYILLSYLPEQADASDVEYEYYIVSGVVMRKVPVDTFDTLYMGTLEKVDDTLLFVSCTTGVRTAILEESHSYAALEAIQKQAVLLNGQDIGVVFAGTGDTEGILVSTLVSSPSTVTCNTVSTDSVATTTKSVDHTSPQ